MFTPAARASSPICIPKLFTLCLGRRQGQITTAATIPDAGCCAPAAAFGSDPDFGQRPGPSLTSLPGSYHPYWNLLVRLGDGGGHCAPDATVKFRSLAAEPLECSSRLSNAHSAIMACARCSTIGRFLYVVMSFRLEISLCLSDKIFEGVFCCMVLRLSSFSFITSIINPYE